MKNAEEKVPAAMVRRVVIASVLGNAFEWFDFAVYGLFSVIIAKLYFPANSEGTSLLLTLATFGVGFAARPVGGILLGIYGDRVGRKKALSLTVALMAIGTALIGILPTYATIGIAAPLLMVAARLLQGFSCGGEFSGATTMLTEFAPRHLRGFFGSFQMCSQALAFAVGALVAYLLSTNLSPADLESWGWRIPFLFGILIGPVGWLIRSSVDESPEFAAHKKTGAATANTPILDVLRRHPRAMLSSFCIVVVGTVSAYVFVFYLPIFARKQFGLSASDVNLSTFASTAVLLLLCPLAGYLSDRFGRRPIILPGIVAYAIAVLFLFQGFVAHPSFGTLLAIQVGAAIFMSFFWGPTPIVLTEMFPVGVRSTGAAISYNVAVLIFGGLAPAINAWLVHKTGSNLAPIFYVEASVIVGLIGAFALPQTTETAPRTATIGI